MATMASNSDDEGLSSHDETTFEPGSWCTKCEAFYRQCKDAAATFGFKLLSSVYSTKTVFACLRSNHRQEVQYGRRIQAGISCAACRKDDRDALKAELRVQEEI